MDGINYFTYDNNVTREDNYIFATRELKREISKNVIERSEWKERWETITKQRKQRIEESEKEKLRRESVGSVEKLGRGKWKELGRKISNEKVKQDDEKNIEKNGGIGR